MPVRCRSLIREALGDAKVMVHAMHRSRRSVNGKVGVEAAFVLNFGDGDMMRDL